MTCIAAHRVVALRTRLLSRLDQQLADMKQLQQQAERACDAFDCRDACRPTLAEFAAELDRDRTRLAEQMELLVEHS